MQINPKWHLSPGAGDILGHYIPEAQLLRCLLSSWNRSDGAWSRLQHEIEAEHFTTSEGRFFYNVFVDFRNRARSFSLDEPSELLTDISRRVPGQEAAILEAALPLLEYTSLDVNYWARLLKLDYDTKEVRKIAQELIQKPNSLDLADKLWETESKIKALRERQPSASDLGYKLAPQLVDEFESLLEAALHPESQQGLVATGFSSIDTLVKIGKGHMIVVGARSGVGKSTFALNIVRNLLDQGKKIAYFALEVAQDEVTRDLVILRTQVSKWKIGDPKRMSTSDWDNVYENNKLLREGNLAVSGKPGMKMAEIEKMLKGMIRGMQGLDVVFIDHMHRVGDDGRNLKIRERYAKISEDIKTMAQSFGVPVFALAQLSREASRDDFPAIHHLRETGSIEQDADTIFLMHRPNHTDLTNPDKTTKVIIAKNRHMGETVILDFDFDVATKRLIEKGKT